MTWWRRNSDRDTTPDMQTGSDATDADEAVQEAKATTRRVERLTRSVQSGLRELEAYRRDNHILDAMMNTLGRHR